MRAWFCDGLTQRNLVDNLRQATIVKSIAVQAAMEAVDRQYYVPDKRNPYADAPQAILKGQTISAPHMHAYALEEVLPHLLQRQKEILQSGDTSQSIKVLDVGCGSGFLTACFGRWFKPNNLLGTQDDAEDPIFTVEGKVFGMDIHNELVSLTRKNMEKADKDLLDDGVVQLRVGNGWKGWPEEAPFDAIHGEWGNAFQQEKGKVLSLTIFSATDFFQWAPLPLPCPWISCNSCSLPMAS